MHVVSWIVVCVLFTLTLSYVMVSRNTMSMVTAATATATQTPQRVLGTLVPGLHDDVLDALFYQQRGTNASRGLYISPENRVGLLASCRTITTPIVFSANECVPIFFISSNRARALQQAIASVLRTDTRHVCIYVIDFGSTDRVLLAFLQSIVHHPLIHIVRERDYGKFGNFKQLSQHVSRVLQRLPRARFYVISDPDIALAAHSDVLTYYATLLLACPALVRVGPALSLWDIPAHYPLQRSAQAWENHFWNVKHALSWRGTLVHAYEAPIDTTFYMMRRGNGQWHRAVLQGLRTGPPYAARHTDWYLDPSRLTPTQQAYVAKSESNWSKWGSASVADSLARCGNAKCPK